MTYLLTSFDVLRISNHWVSIDFGQVQLPKVAFAGLSVSVIVGRAKLPNIVVFSSYSTFGDTRRILPKLYESTCRTISKCMRIQNLLLISHHKFSPPSFSIWTFHLVFAYYPIPVFACVFWEWFKEVIVDFVVESNFNVSLFKEIKLLRKL
jgi:hypothetical protein